MSKFFLLFLSLPLALTLSGASGIASDTSAPDAVTKAVVPPGSREKNLSLFIDALLEKDPDIQCKKLLEVVAADPANAETPLKAFFSSFKKVKNKTALLAQFNGIWKKSPENFFLALFGVELNKICGTPARERLAQLKHLNSLSPEKLCTSPGWTREMSVSLLHNTAICCMELRQYDTLGKLFEKWTKTPVQHRLALYVTLGSFCHTAAARSYCSGDPVLGKELEKCFNASISGLKEIESSVSDNKEAWSILLLYSSYRQILGDKPLRFAEAFYRRSRSANANVWRLGAAVDCGNMTILNAAVKEISAANPRFDASELRFKTLLNAGKFAEAAKELSSQPEKRHFELRRELYMKQKEWQKLQQLVTDRLRKGAPADAASGIILLTSAEHLRSIPLYRQALRILAPHLGNPAVANAVGYIGAVLEQDLPNARKLLESALSKEPGNYAYLDSMAWICFKQKRYAEAEKWIKKALAAATPREGMAVILDHAGDIAAAQGKNPRYWYELAVKYAPFDNECNPADITKKLKALK